MARMLRRAGQRRVRLRRGRCRCSECFIDPGRKVQRTRERRTWRREAVRDDRP